MLLETHKFRQLKQITEETIDQYCTRLRQQAIICEFTNSENEFKIQLVEGCLSSRVRRKAIQDDLSLANILAYARSLEITDKAVKTLEEDCGHLAPSLSAVNSIHNQQEKPSQYHERTNKQPHQSATQYLTRNRYSYPLRNSGRENSHDQQQNGKKLCYNCGENYYAGHLSVCRAKGKSCFSCGKQNHFATMCRSRPRNNIPEKGENIQAINCTEKQSNSSDEDSYVFVVTPPVETEVSPNPRAVKTIPVIIERAHVKMIVDTGATTNILDYKAFNEIKKKNPSLHLQPSTHKIYAYMQSQPLPVLGKFEGLIESKHRMAVRTFHVVNGDGGSLLSYATATELDIVKMNVHAVVTQSSSTSYTDPREDHKQFGNENPEIPKNHQPDSPIMSKFKNEYPAVFNGIGKLKGHEVHLHLKDNAKPIVQKPRKIPFHLRKQTENKLNELEESDIIEFVPSGTPTPLYQILLLHQSLII